MADWSQLVKGFQEGANFSQDFRARKQIEKARDQALESGEYGLQARRAFRRVRDPMTEGALGKLDPSSVQDYEGLEDPFAIQLFNWAKGKMRRKKRALDIGEGMSSAGGAPNPSTMGDAPDVGAIPDTGAMTFALPDEPQAMPAYADGGEVSRQRLRDEMENLRREEERYARRREGSSAGRSAPDEMERLARQQESNARREILKERVSSGARKAIDTTKDAYDTVNKKTGDFMNVRPKEGQGFLRRSARAVKGAGALAALATTAGDAASTDTEEYRKRFGLETNDPSLLGDIGVRTLGAASDLGNNLTMGLAQKGVNAITGRWPSEQTSGEPPAADPLVSEADIGSAAGTLNSDTAGSVSMGATSRRPAAIAPKPEIVDFSDIDTTHADLPNMQVGDWVKYRARMVDAARQSGDPAAVKQANDMVTNMQMEGFHAYGQQGMALQQAGNLQGAMSAYRAAFQYFPNGNDVEFGLHNDRKTGRKQIVGFGKSEQDGKVIPGSEIIMDPERVAVLLENFKNPQAWRMWTKDWRDDQFKERQYQEVTKPLAQAQADYMATNADANVLRAENTALRAGGAGGAGAAANMRNAEHVFRERVQMLGMTDEAQSDFLANVMSQIKARNPNTPDNTIVQAVMQSVRDGSLAQRLQKMGIAPPVTPSTAPPAAGAPRRALPVGDDADYAPQSVDEELEQMSPEDREWATRPAQ